MYIDNVYKHIQIQSWTYVIYIYNIYGSKWDFDTHLHTYAYTHRRPYNVHEHISFTKVFHRHIYFFLSDESWYFVPNNLNGMHRSSISHWVKWLYLCWNKWRTKSTTDWGMPFYLLSINICGSVLGSSASN